MLNRFGRGKAKTALISARSQLYGCDVHGARGRRRGRSSGLSSSHCVAQEKRGGDGGGEKERWRRSTGMRQRKAQPWLPGPHSLGRQGRRMRGEGAKGKSIVGGICLKKGSLGSWIYMGMEISEERVGEGGPGLLGGRAVCGGGCAILRVWSVSRRGVFFFF